MNQDHQISRILQFTMQLLAQLTVLAQLPVQELISKPFFTLLLCSNRGTSSNCINNWQDHLVP